MLPKVSAKLHTMRKAQEFIVMPMSDGNVMVQSDKSIGTYDPATGKGRLSVKGYTFIDLSLKGFAYEFPAEFREAVTAVLPTPGGTTSLAGGAIIVQNTVQVI